jgi:hypothetical protein
LGDISRPGVTRVPPECKRDCPNRSWDCHPKCDIYIKYRAKCDEEMKKRDLERVVMNEVCDTVERIRKKRRERR